MRIFAVLLFGCAWSCASAATGLKDLSLLGTNRVLSGGVWSIDSGATLTFSAGANFAGDAAAFRAAIGAGTSSFDGAFGSLSGKPTTLSGYGITDGITAAAAASTYVALGGSYEDPDWLDSLAWSKIVNTPTSAAAYGIANGAAIDAIGANGGAHYLSRANHTGMQAWSTITSTPTTLGGYGITDAQPLMPALTAIAGLSTPNALLALDGDGQPYALEMDDLELSFRQGSDAERQTVVFASGEPVWTTDTYELYVGDGVTMGGVRPRVSELWGSYEGVPTRLVRSYYSADEYSVGIQVSDGADWAADFSFSEESWTFGRVGGGRVAWTTPSSPTTRITFLYPSVSSSFSFPAPAITETSFQVVSSGSRWLITTTNATPTTIGTIAVPAQTTRGIVAFVTARRGSGSAGTAEDGAFYEVKAVAKGNAGNNASLIGSALVTAIGESQAGWDVTVSTSGGTVLIRVTGAANNNIAWTAVVYTY